MVWDRYWNASYRQFLRQNKHTPKTNTRPKPRPRLGSTPTLEDPFFFPASGAPPEAAPACPGNAKGNGKAESPPRANIGDNPPTPAPPLASSVFFFLYFLRSFGAGASLHLPASFGSTTVSLLAGSLEVAEVSLGLAVTLAGYLLSLAASLSFLAAALDRAGTGLPSSLRARFLGLSGACGAVPEDGSETETG